MAKKRKKLYCKRCGEVRKLETLPNGGSHPIPCDCRMGKENRFVGKIVNEESSSHLRSILSEV